MSLLSSYPRFGQAADQTFADRELSAQFDGMSATEPSRVASSFVPETLSEPGSLIANRYSVLRMIASGGMGVVYACIDRILERQVAVKLIRRAPASDNQTNERFLREARVAAQLRSPHVAQVFDFGVLPDGQPYIVMELLEGENLLTVLLNNGPLPAAQVVKYMLQVCEGLLEVHSKGIVHRDVKPENLALASKYGKSDLVKIVDFGVSKPLYGGRLTMPGVSIGSPCYASPEQLQAASDVDIRTDIWSIGVVLFQLLTGEAPFKGTSLFQISAAVLRDPVPKPSSLRRDIPAALDAIILRCLEKDKEDRFANVEELLAAFRALPAAMVEREHRSPGVASERRPRRSIVSRRKSTKSLMLAVVCALLCASSLWLPYHELYRIGQSLMMSASHLLDASGV